MQYMLIYKEPLAESAKRNDPAQAPAYWAAWGAYVGSVRDAGIIVNGDGLQPPETATMVQMRHGKRLVQDGPFADTKEHLGGYHVIEVPSLDVALGWAEKSPAALAGTVEVRPILPPPPKVAA